MMESGDRESFNEGGFEGMGANREEIEKNIRQKIEQETRQKIEEDLKQKIMNEFN